MVCPRLFICFSVCQCLMGTNAVSIVPSYLTVDTEERQNVTLPCNIETDCPDSPQITWYKGEPGTGQRVFSVNTAGKLLVNSNYTGRVDREGQAGLVIISPDPSDAGNYSCEALITIDIPPIASGHVFLKVSVRQKSDTDWRGRSVSLALAVLDTVTFVFGVLSVFLSNRTGFQDHGVKSDKRSADINSRRRMSHVCEAYFRLCWMGLCLIGGTVLWIYYTLTFETKSYNCIGTSGVVLSVVGVTLCVLCQVHGIITWLRDRKDGLNEDIMMSTKDSMLPKEESI